MDNIIESYDQYLLSQPRKIDGPTVPGSVTESHAQCLTHLPIHKVGTQLRLGIGKAWIYIPIN